MAGGLAGWALMRCCVRHAGKGGLNVPEEGPGAQSGAYEKARLLS